MLTNVNCNRHFRSAMVKLWVDLTKGGAILLNLSRVMRKPTFCICENKEAYQRLCFRYIDSTIPLLSKSEHFKLLAIFCGFTAWFVSDQVGNQNVGLLTTRLSFHWHCTLLSTLRKHAYAINCDFNGRNNGDSNGKMAVVQASDSMTASM